MKEPNDSDFKILASTLPHKRALEQIVVKHEETKMRYMFKSCCFRIDVRMMRFLVQFVLSLIVLAFCIFQLALTDLDDGGKCTYVSILSTTLAFWLEAPRV